MTAYNATIQESHRFGRVTVLTVESRQGMRSVYTVRCDCGEEFRATEYALVSAENYSCVKCRHANRRKARTRCCTLCGDSSHVRSACPDRVVRYQPGAGIRCVECAGISDRRDKGGCRGCGEPYEPEPPVTVEYIHSLPRPAARPVPIGGW